MSQSLPSAMLLDMDDTILADTAATAECWRVACERLAPREITVDALLKEIDTVRRWYWDDPIRHRAGRLDLRNARAEIVAIALRQLGTHDAALALAIAEMHSDLREQAICPFPGAIETLGRLRAHGVRLALLTNGHTIPQRRKIERFALAPFFDCIMVEGEFGCGKPDERVYRHALGALGVSAAETWMAGDNLEWDIAAPQRLGIYAMWVDWAGTGLPESSRVQPDRIIRSISELAPLTPAC